MQIREVTAQGVYYIDDRGREQYLDFATCLEEYIYQLDYPRGSRPTVAENIRRAKTIGKVDYWGIYHGRGVDFYAEFYDKNLTCFEFGNEQECKDFAERVNASGWFLREHLD